MPDLVRVFQRTIEMWMIPDIVATGIMDHATAVAYARYIGMGERDADLLVQYGESKAKAPAAGQAAELAKISAAQAGQMFDDAIIDRNTYIEILLAHGFSQQAAELTVALDVQKGAIASRKATATQLVAQVDLGQITEAAMTSELYRLGYSAGEVAT